MSFFKKRSKNKSRKENQSCTIYSYLKNMISLELPWFFAVLFVFLLLIFLNSELKQENKDFEFLQSSWDSQLTDYTKIKLLTGAGYNDVDAKRYYLMSYNKLPQDVKLRLEWITRNAP